MAKAIVDQVEDPARLRRIAEGRVRITTTGYDPHEMSEVIQREAAKRMRELASQPERPGFWRSVATFLTH